MKAFIFSAATAAPAAAFAHADHSHQPLTMWHALTQPDHAAMIAVGLLALGAVIFKSRQSRRDAARSQSRDKLSHGAVSCGPVK
ncbi:hypothetical protein [Albirhodobacter sp. R86504]|jgi:hydrogenase/urease accessory protein HupE|uniref:hypothetical protein n=1 Tax=Albirhodobacter sp. R86504 TaxID=3093848 RepID=UPI00366A6FEB